MKCYLAAFSVCVALHTASARIGETPVQVAERLGAGKPGVPAMTLPAGAEAKEYRKNDFTVTVIFYKGVSQCEQYTKGGNSLSDVEVNTILQNNVFSGAWEQDLENARFGSWTWTGGKMVAVYYKELDPPILIMETAGFKADADAAKTAKDKDTAGGL